jgi:hypothetical protein
MPSTSVVFSSSLKVIDSKARNKSDFYFGKGEVGFAIFVEGGIC